MRFLRPGSGLASCILGLVLLAAAAAGARAQDAGTTQSIAPLPFYWHWPDGADPPDYSKLNGLTFLTDSDYPPFNYRDESGDLVGFNVDIAKAICSALRVRCRIAARAWGELIPALRQGQADAVIASIAINAANRKQVDFSWPYYRSPARFVVQKESPLESAAPSALAGKPVAVRAGTAHEAYLKTFFADADIQSLASVEETRGALLSGKVDAVFGDGTSLMFWLNGTASQACCRFLPGAFTESRYFGNGAGIAVARDNALVRDSLNYALDRIKVSGAYDRIYRKHFPLQLY